MSDTKRIFLTAEWRKLIMANYTIDPAILMSFLPAHTELDQWNGEYYVSLVGFMFDKVRIKGMSVPFHRRFPEINLRFYVKYKEAGQWKRGVVFIREIVPRPAITWVANTIYKENYATHKMKNNSVVSNEMITVTYQWKKKKWNRIEVVANNVPAPLKEGSKEEFITEHFWGYAKRTAIQTVEYHVEHPRWDIYSITNYIIECDFEKVYGQPFAFLNNKQPASVFMAEGSPVKIYEKIEL